MPFEYNYYVYILECSDKSYYTGVTNNIERRLNEHNEGLDPKCYTYKRKPVILKYYQHFLNIHDAIAWEKRIKGWSRKKKEALINENWDELKKWSLRPNQRPL